MGGYPSHSGGFYIREHASTVHAHLGGGPLWSLGVSWSLLFVSSLVLLIKAYISWR